MVGCVEVVPLDDIVFRGAVNDIVSVNVECVDWDCLFMDIHYSDVLFAHGNESQSLFYYVRAFCDEYSLCKFLGEFLEEKQNNIQY